jgi:transcriptional regulator with XRE-family HTH domain
MLPQMPAQRSLHLASNLKYLRGLRSWSQVECADKFGSKRAAWGSYEEGRAEPPLHTLIRFAAYFKLTVEQLYNEDLHASKLSPKVRNPAATVYSKKAIEKTLMRLIGHGSLVTTILEELNECPD